MKFCFAFCVYFALAYGSVPEYFPKCKRNDPEIEQCILNGIEAMKPRLKDGIPEINLPPLDPLMLEYLYVNTTLTGAVLKATIKNLVAHGGSNFKITKLNIDLDGKYAAKFKLAFPNLIATADYDSQGSRFLFFYINGSGKFKGSFNDVAVAVKCVASPFVKKEVEYLKIDSITTKVSIGNGDLEINPNTYSFTGRAASTFVHSSPSTVLNILKPVIDETVAPIVQKYLDDVLSSLPIKDVLIDS